MKSVKKKVVFITEKTVKELADELGVSKQRVMYHVKKLSTKEHQKKDNTIYINEIGQKAIKSRLEDLKADKQTDKKSKSFADKEYINTLKEQLDKKDKQLEKMEKLLDQQQQLHLQANQRIEHLERQLAVEPPKEETPQKDDEAVQSYQEKIGALEKQVAEDEKINKELYAEYERLSHLEEEYQNKLAKKWYHFWK